MRIKIILNLFLLSIFTMCLVSCSSCQSEKQKKVAPVAFEAPTPPAMMSAQEDRLNYMVDNYWKKFDFADTTQISRGDFIDSHFYNYLNNYLYVADVELAKKALVNIIATAHQKDSVMFAHFIKTSERYFYNPNSPFRNEEFYIVVLDYVVNAPNIDDINKVRPKYHLEMAKKNRPGSVAADFAYTLANGKSGKLSGIKADYTLIFFNDPECPDCKRIKGYISDSEVFRKLIYGGGNPNLKVLAIYPDEDIELWKTGVYPKGWINGYDKGMIITNENLYAVPAMPCLYLLDKDKKVIFKDASVEQMAQWLTAKIEK